MIQGRQQMRTRSARNSKHRLLASDAGAAAISRLPELLRWIFILGEREGLSTVEIARLAGTSIEAIKSMRQRGLAIIRNERVIPFDCAS